MKSNNYILLCDESGFSAKEKFLVIGSLAIPEELFFDLEKSILESRYQEKVWGEIKWSKSSDKKHADFYLNQIKKCFNKTNIFYKAIIVEKNLIDYKTYHNNDKKVAYLKFYRLLLKRKINKIDCNNFYILIDRPSASDELVDNFKHFTRTCISSNKKIECISRCDSHISNLLQVADLITGAIAYFWNNGSEEENEKNKIIVNYLEEKFNLKISNKEYDPIPTTKRFEIWKWKPSSIKV